MSDVLPDLLADLNRVRAIVEAARNYTIAYDALVAAKAAYNGRGASRDERLLDALCEAETHHSSVLSDLRKALRE